MTPLARLRGAIIRSGLSVTEYVIQVLKYDDATARRWLQDKEPIPPAVVRFLKAGL